jgi:hypothetical protein
MSVFNDNGVSSLDELDRMVPCVGQNFLNETFGNTGCERTRGFIGGTAARRIVRASRNANTISVSFPVWHDCDFVEDLYLCTPARVGSENEEVVLGARLTCGGTTISCLETAEQVRCARWAENRDIQVCNSPLYEETDGPRVLSPIPLGLSIIPTIFLDHNEIAVVVEIPESFAPVIDDIHIMCVRSTIQKETRLTLNIYSPRRFFITQSQFAGANQVSMVPVNRGARGFRGIIDLSFKHYVEFLYVCGVDAADLSNVSLLTMHKEAETEHTDSEKGPRKEKRHSGEVMFDRTGKDVVDFHGRIGWDNPGIIIPVGPLDKFSLPNRIKSENEVLNFCLVDSASLSIETTKDIEDIRVYAFNYNLFSIMSGLGGVRSEEYNYRSVGASDIKVKMPTPLERGLAETCSYANN